MKNENDIKNEKVRHYFPGGNTSNGFVSFYNNILRSTSVGKLGIIKGGPGTGKSSLMKRVGKFFEEKGEYVHYLHCSSDCNSLDGVYLPKFNSAIIDGTSPHTVDCRYAGCYDKIFDVGIYIDDNIKNFREEIKETDDNIKAHFSASYEYLRVSKAILDIMERRSKDALDMGEVNNFCLNITKRVMSNNDSGKVRKMFLSAITPQGLKNYINTVMHDKYVIKLDCDVGDNAGFILKKILSYAQNQNIDTDIFYCPLNPDKPEHIVFVNSHLALTVSNKFHNTSYADEVVYFSDFVKKDYNNQKEAEEYEKYIKKAINELVKAKKLHDKLESYYVKNFDYSKMDVFYENIIDFMSL